MNNKIFVNTSILKKFRFTFKKEVEIPNDIFIAKNETPYKAFQSFRDILIITNQRFIIFNKQRISGKKTQTYSIPFNIIMMHSIENPYKYTINTKVLLWTMAGKITLRLNKNIDTLKIEEFLYNITIKKNS